MSGQMVYTSGMEDGILDAGNKGAGQRANASGHGTDVRSYAVRLDDNTRVRFWAKVQRSDGCWLWTAGKTTGGYGMFRVDLSNASRKAHRVAWELTYGSIPAGLLVLHHCDVRACVRPDHLWLGTAADNIADMVRKGRAGPRAGSIVRGEEHHRSILTEDRIIAIRRLATFGDMSNRRIAHIFGVSPKHIAFILNGKAWSHVGA